MTRAAEIEKAFAEASEWARQVAERQDVPSGIRSAARGVHAKSSAALALPPDPLEVENLRLRETLRECEAELQLELEGLLDSACSLDRETGEPIRGTEDEDLKPDIERVEALLGRVRAALSKHGGTA